MIHANRRARVAALAALEADKDWHKSDSMGVWRANYSAAVEIVLAAALPHLTDDGAAAPPADSTGVGAPAAAESATTTAAPSSPHPYDEATYTRVHHFMRGWYQGEVISASVTAGEGQAPLTYSDLGALLDAFKGEGATPAIDREALRAAERQQVAQSIRDEAVDEAVDGFVQLTAVIRMCEEAGR